MWHEMQYLFVDVLSMTFPPPSISKTPAARPGINQRRNLFIAV
jgi:hypothetical protein